MEAREIVKKGLSILLTGSMLLSGISMGGGNMQTVQAAENSTPDVTKYATKAQLMKTFDLDGKNDTVGKVYFGTGNGTPLQWYIAGKDNVSGTEGFSDDNIVLFSTQHFEDTQFQTSSTAGNDYTGSNLETEINNLCYGGSKAKFTKGEDGLMLQTPLKYDGTSTPKLYAPNLLDSSYNGFVTVGAEDSLRIDKQYYEESCQAEQNGSEYLWGFWIRKTLSTGSNNPLDKLYAYSVDPEAMKMMDITYHCRMVPAFALNLRSVLFASAAQTEVASAKLQDALTLRMDGSNKIASKAKYTDTEVTVTKDDKDTGLYLYVQGNNGEDWVYSKEITETGTVTAEDIKASLNGNDTISLTKCKIWLETTSKEENLSYAVMAVRDSASGEGDNQQSEKEVLESLNFKLSEDSSYKTDDITPGRQYVQEYDELICSIYNRNTGSRKVYIEDGIDRIIQDDTNKNALLGEFAESATYYKYRYSMSTTFDRDGDECKDSLATICLHRNGGAITMDVMDLATGDMIMKNQNTGGYLYVSNSIQPWDNEGLLSITAGDYDGDGREEVAVYTPNNCYVSDGSNDFSKAEDESKLEISIFRITENSQNLDRPVSKIEIADADNCPNWRTATNSSGSRNYWYLPYLSMETADLNHDGRDDLLTVASFQEKHVLSKNSYTWKEVMDPNTCLGSVLDIYEGKANGRFDQTVNKKVLLSYNKEDSNPYGLLRNASVTVANVTGPGSEEITFAGAVTKVNYNTSNVTEDTVVANSNIVLYDNSSRESAFMPRIGYVSYERLKMDEGNKFSSMDYTWTKSFLLTNQKVYLNDDNANDLVYVASYAQKGRDYADTIVVGSERFRYDNTENQLKSYGSQWNKTGSKTSNRWYGKPAVGNVKRSQDGKEEIFFVYYMKIRSEDDYHSDSYRIGNNTNITDSDHIWWSKVTDNFQSLNLAVCDVNQDSTMIEYTDGNSELFYSNPEVLSVLQAAPVYEELGEDYTGDAETSYSKSSGGGKGSAYESVVSAGVVAGFEKEFNILGFQSVGGVEMEASVSAAFGRSSEYTTSKTYTTTYNTTGTEDVALLYTVPYVRYNCKIFIPAYDMPSEEEYNAKKAFASELKEHLEKCVEQKAAVTGGIYAAPPKGDYNEGYTTNVSPATYKDQLVVYYDYLQWIENTEKSIVSFEQGGTCEWGQHMEAGWQDYFYNMPQTPVVTTIPVSAYDQVASKNPKLDTIADAVFGENYRSGDPATYQHSISDIEALGGTNILSGKSGVGNAADDTGFIYSTAISASGSSPSQSIAIDEKSETTISRGIATEATFKVKAGDVYAGVTASAELNSSATCSTTLGCEYSGTVPNLPKGTPASYGYGWKLVSYNMDVNGKTIPVVGYVTKMTNQAPPSVASNLEVTAETDNSITLTWENGIRPAHHYGVYRVDVVKKENVYTLLKKGIIPDEKGSCTFTDDDGGKGLFYDTQYSYVVVSYNEDESLQSVYSKEVTGLTTIPEMEFVATVEGVVEGKEYVPNTALSMKVTVDSSQDISWRVRSYNWEYSDGSDWQSTDVITKNMNLVVDRSMDGRKYRCKVNLYAGSLSNGKDYEIYTKPVTVSVKRYIPKMILTGEKIGNPVEESAAYGPLGDQLQITATVSSDEILVTGGKVIFALYKEDAEEAVTFEANVSEQGIAKTEIPITEPGNYCIKAQYEACEPLENCDAVKEYTYYAYEEGTTPDFTISGDNQAKIDTTAGDIVYTGDEINPEIELIWNGTNLQKSKDYNVEYSNNTASGNATANITGAGRFENMEQQTIDFIIRQAEEVVNTPDADFHVGVSCVDLNTLNTLLPEGWSVQGDNAELVVGEPKTVSIVYTGEDAANYRDKATTKQITVTRADHEHTAGNVLYTGKEDITPTCITVGIGHTECTVCGCTLESGIKTALDVSGHKWSATYTVDYEATCVKKGKESIHCEKCNAIKAGTSREYGELKEHAWDAGEIIKEPTDTEEGKKTYTCKECGDTKTEAVPATGTQDDNKGGNAGNNTSDKIPVVNAVLTDAKTKAVYKVTKADRTGGEVEFHAPKNKKITKITIPATVTVDGITYSVTGIAQNAFKGCTKLTSVTMGANVAAIGANAFYGDTKLKTITIGKNVATIGAKAFYKCSALKKITIPSKVAKIGKSAFEGCKSLKTITIKTQKLKSGTVGSKAFKGTPKNVTIKVQKKSLKAYKKFLYSKGVSKKAKIKK
ncbi:MAG: leucine-rich repeat protein [Acetatifactor sp.]